MRLSYLIYIVIGILAGALAAVVALPNARTALEQMAGLAPQPPTTTTTGKAKIGGPFKLQSTTGQDVTDADFRGKPMLVFFGFTHCPDICPSGLQVLSAAIEKVGGKALELVPVFITLDPERDTGPLLASYIKSFRPGIVALTGSRADIDAAAKTYRVYHQKVPAGSDYTIDHSAIFYVMDETGTYKGHIPHTTNVDEFADALKKILYS